MFPQGIGGSTPLRPTKFKQIPQGMEACPETIEGFEFSPRRKCMKERSSSSSKEEILDRLDRIAGGKIQPNIPPKDEIIERVQFAARSSPLFRLLDTWEEQI